MHNKANHARTCKKRMCWTSQACSRMLTRPVLATLTLTTSSEVMSRIDNLALSFMALVSLAYSYVHIRYGLAESEVSVHTEYLWLVVFALLLALWAIKEPKQKEFGTYSAFGLFMFLAWPLVLPYHLIKTRGLEGVVLFLGFVGLYYLPFLSGLIAYVYYS